MAVQNRAAHLDEGGLLSLCLLGVFGGSVSGGVCVCFGGGCWVVACVLGSVVVCVSFYFLKKCGWLWRAVVSGGVRSGG